MFTNTTPPQTHSRRECASLVVVGSTFGEKKKKDRGTVTYGHPLWVHCANRLLFFGLLDPEQTESCNRQLYLPNERERERECGRKVGGRNSFLSLVKRENGDDKRGV